MVLKSLCLKLKRLEQKYKLLMRIYLIVIVPWFLYFLYLLFNNFSSEVIRKTLMPGLVVGFISIAISWYFGIKNIDKSGKFLKGVWPKFIQAVTLGFISSFFALYNSLEAETIDETFPLRLIIHQETGETLEKYDKRYNLFYGAKHFQARRYLQYKPKTSFKENEWRRYTFNYPFDLFFVEVLSVGLTSCEQAGTMNPVGGGAYRYFPDRYLIWPKFPEAVYEQLEPGVQEMCSELQKIEILKHMGLDKMCLPKGTKVKLEYSDTWDHKTNKAFCKTIKLKNQFCEINIDVTYYGGENRIQDWGAGQSLKWRWILGIDDEINKKFGTYTGRVYFNAKFNKMLSGHPDMPKYKNWARELVWRLQWHLDSDEQLKKAEQEYLIYNTNITDFMKRYEKKVTTEVERNDPNNVDNE